MLSYRLIFIVIAFLFGAILISLLRRRKIKEQYVWEWLALDLFASIALFLPISTLNTLASFLGFEVASNMMLVIVLLVLVVISIHLGVAISSLTDERRRLAEDVAILRLEIEDFERLKNQTHDGSDTA